MKPTRGPAQRASASSPSEVTDIIVSHSHWDHADGADLFPNATIWIQKRSTSDYIGANGRSAAPRRRRRRRREDVGGAEGRGTRELVDGDDQEILPGIRVYTGGKHTFASQFVGVATRAGTVVLASDNAYLYENLEKQLAIAQTLDAASNLAAQARMLTLAAAPQPASMPGHDPAVFERFPVVKPGVVRID